MLETGRQHLGEILQPSFAAVRIFSGGELWVMRARGTSSEHRLCEVASRGAGS
ncbi:hypothetical protein N9L68_05760 [bacterium]|nr:hypothetical protein [bacterium]